MNKFIFLTKLLTCLLIGASAQARLISGNKLQMVKGNELLTQKPFSQIGVLLWTMKNEMAVANCTVSLVGPRHAITAAHCIEASKNADERWVEFGVHVKLELEVPFWAESFFNESHPDWSQAQREEYLKKDYMRHIGVRGKAPLKIQKILKSSDDDIALLVLEPNEFIEKEYLALGEAKERDLQSVKVYGYPSSRSMTPHVSVCEAEPAIFKSDVVNYGCSTESGMSGGPVMLTRGEPVIIGIHSERNLFIGNEAVRFGKAQIALIRHWISKNP